MPEIKCPACLDMHNLPVTVFACDGSSAEGSVPCPWCRHFPTPDGLPAVPEYAIWNQPDKGEPMPYICHPIAGTDNWQVIGEHGQVCVSLSYAEQKSSPRVRAITLAAMLNGGE